jgi:hypothetical protein
MMCLAWILLRVLLQPSRLATTYGIRVFFACFPLLAFFLMVTLSQFAASPKHVAFERAPYSNRIEPCHVTRFIALADSFNEKKQKFRYAFNMLPMKQMDQAELLAIPPNTTIFPFMSVRVSCSIMVAQEASEIAELENLSFLTAQKADAQNLKKRSFQEVEKREIKQMEQPSYPRFQQTTGGPPQQKKPKIEQRSFLTLSTMLSIIVISTTTGPTDAYCSFSDPLLKRTAGCWFCLSNPEVEKHLILSIGEESYVALAKGGLNSQHCLIIPIAHAKSFTTLDGSVKDEMNKFGSSVVVSSTDILSLTYGLLWSCWE